MKAIDLFAGAGGASEGARQAGVEVVWAANHWQPTVQCHARNHPGSVIVCHDLNQADWSKVPRHNLLLASPACQGHSPARGKERPHHDAQRNTAGAVIDAVEFHRPDAWVVENVPDFANWVRYPGWCAEMKALGYSLAPMLIDAADCGVPQHRVRLIIVGTKSAHPIKLDLPHCEHRPATNFIDFNSGRWSPIVKPRRAVTTLARIARARPVFGDRFVMPYYGSGSGLTGRSLDRPIGTITTVARWAVVDGDRMRMLTVDENRRAMGFRDDYHLPTNTAVATKMLGNAVPPAMTCAVITALWKAA